MIESVRFWFLLKILPNMLLKSEFYQRPTVAVAKSLLGTFIVHESKQGTTVGRVVETEAYLFKKDPACHAHKGMTKRNAAMFGPAGTAYVYLIYGMYHCLNVVTAKEGVGEAVLIRALEPVDGWDLMERRRETTQHRNLCSGPGKLVMAMGVTRDHDGCCLRSSSLTIASRESYPELFPRNKRPKIVTTTRIGISQGAELPLRFYIEDNPYISKK